MALKYKTEGTFTAVGGVDPGVWWASTPVEIDTGSATITYSGTANTKSGWSQLIASTTADAGFLYISTGLIRDSATNTAALLDVGIGAAGSETVIVPNLSIGGSTELNHLVPVKVPAGSRVAVRYQCAAARNLPVTVATYSSPSYSKTPTALAAIGVDTSTSTGTAITTVGTWTELTASTADDYSGFVLCGAVNGSSTLSNNINFVLGYGPAGSEVELGSTVFTFTSTESVSNRRFPLTLIGTEVPAGSRLAFKRTNGPGGIGTDTNYGFSVLAVPAV